MAKRPLSLAHPDREPGETQTPKRRIRAEQHREAQVCCPCMQGKGTYQTAQQTTRDHEAARRTRGDAHRRDTQHKHRVQWN